MINSVTGEVILMIFMFTMILIVCAVAVFLFARQYRKEMREKAERKKK